MFKQVQSGFAKFFTKERVFILFVFILLSWVLLSYSSSKNAFNKEGMSSLSDYIGPSTNTQQSQQVQQQRPVYQQPQPQQFQQAPQQPPPVFKPAAKSSSSSIQPSMQPSINQPQHTTVTDFGSLGSTASPFSQEVANPSDLLPKDENSQWAALNPNTMTKGDILMPDLLQAGYHIGLDTIGQTLRNPNLQLRSDPIIPKQDIGPWNLSTIEPDIGRVPLEISDGR